MLNINNITVQYGNKNPSIVNLSMDMKPGEIVSIVGESGSGKSTLANIIMKLEKADSGTVILNDKDITNVKRNELKEVYKDIQMVFQDPNTSFNPRMKVRDIICEPLLNFGLIKKNQRDDIAKEFLEMVDLPKDFSNRYIHNMSGGQRQRIGIARALTLNPKVVIFDESTSALDVLTQKKIIDLIIKLQKEKNITIGLVCHDIHLVSQISDKVAVMYLGNLVEVIPGRKLQGECKHPYTQTLISSTFHLNMNYSKKIENIKEAENPIDISKGCPFKNRCKYSIEICKDKKPELKLVSKNHYVACHLNNGEEE